MSASAPEAVAVRRPSRRIADRPMWVVRRCPYCRRAHAHPADAVATALIVPAKCDPSRFYTVREVTDGGRPAA